MPNAGDTRPCPHYDQERDNKCDGIQTYRLGRPHYSAGSVTESETIMDNMEKNDGWECSEYHPKHFDKGTAS